MKAIIIDDEENSRNTLRNFLNKYCDEVHILDEADGVESGLKAIKKHEPDVVFLDVEMKDGTGFDLLSLLKPVSFGVIFITAFDQYAVRAFNFSAVDYLLKPLDPARLAEAVNKLKIDRGIGILQKKLEVLLENKTTPVKLAIPAVDGLAMLRVSSVMRCESEGNYTRFYLTSGETHLATKTLKEYDELLSGLNFFRIHKSHLINLEYVLRYVKGEGGTIIMEDRTQLEVARRRKEGLLQVLKSR
nr:response regulator transcription factor [Bacteroidota bacterium]